MTRYIRENKNTCTIVKNQKNYGKFKTIDDAIIIRDTLITHNWELTQIPEVIKNDDEYIIIGVIDEKVHLIAKTKNKPSDELVDKLIKKQKRNPNNSRYGLNITRVFDTFIIQKQIMGDEYTFGYYDNLEDAEFVRNHLMDNQWNTRSFNRIMHDKEKDNYKITLTIDDKVYVIDKIDDEDEIDLEASIAKFLTRIQKHRHGLESHPHLDELTDRVNELEKTYNVRARDENWNFENANDPLNDIVFNMTPWQKIVYDATDDSTIDDIKKSLARYKSKNFDEKIQKNIDELIRMNLITEKDEKYNKK